MPENVDNAVGWAIQPYILGNLYRKLRKKLVTAIEGCARPLGGMADTADLKSAAPKHPGSSPGEATDIGWLIRSLAAVEQSTKDWPEWKRKSVDTEPYLAIPSNNISD